MAVIERIRRALADVSDHVSQTIGPTSQAFGEAFGCENWAVQVRSGAAACRSGRPGLCCAAAGAPGAVLSALVLTASPPFLVPVQPSLQLFPEEVVRGGPAFAVSLVLTAAEPHLRGAAELGAWQIISPANCWGRLEVVPDLHGIQEKVGGCGQGRPPPSSPHPSQPPHPTPPHPTTPPPPPTTTHHHPHTHTHTTPTAGHPSDLSPSSGPLCCAPQLQCNPADRCLPPSSPPPPRQVYSEPTILLAKRVTGEEEVPDGVVGLIRCAAVARFPQHITSHEAARSTQGCMAACSASLDRPCTPTLTLARAAPPPPAPPHCSGDCPDVLSHLSVRARNMKVCFASCYDPAQLEEVQKLAGKVRHGLGLGS